MLSPQRRTHSSQTDRIFDIADVPFSQASDEVKQKYVGKMLETGSYQGYKLRQYWVRFRIPVPISDLDMVHAACRRRRS